MFKNGRSVDEANEESKKYGDENLEEKEQELITAAADRH